MKNVAITPPEWFARGSIYQINPRTFSKEGTIAAIIRELGTIADLGFSVVYLCPIFKEDDDTDRAFWSERQKKSGTDNPKNPYRMNDYFTVDVEYGTTDDLKALVAEAHRLGLKVLLDLVYFHIGPNADILKTHPEFAKRDENGNPLCGVWQFPLLDYSCDGLREYLWCNMVYYVSVFDVDGYRCDVGDRVPLDFWEEGRRRIQAVKADAVLLLEGETPDYMRTGFDATYSFKWHEQVYAAFAQDAPASVIREQHETLVKNAPFGMTVMRDIDNHDTVTDWLIRTEIAAGHDGMEQIEVLNYLIDGIPMVYSGNELADTARHSMFANRFFMGDYQVTDRKALIGDESVRRQQIIKALNGLKHESDLLRFGNTIWVDNTDPKNVISFLRVYGDQRLLFVGNVKPHEAVCELMVDEIPSTVLFESRNKVAVDDDRFTLPARSYIVLGV